MWELLSCCNIGACHPLNQPFLHFQFRLLLLHFTFQLGHLHLVALASGTLRENSPGPLQSFVGLAPLNPLLSLSFQGVAAEQDECEKCTAFSKMSYCCLRLIQPVLVIIL